MDASEGHEVQQMIDHLEQGSMGGWVGGRAGGWVGACMGVWVVWPRLEAAALLYKGALAAADGGHCRGHGM